MILVSVQVQALLDQAVEASKQAHAQMAEVERLLDQALALDIGDILDGPPSDEVSLVADGRSVVRRLRERGWSFGHPGGPER